MVRARGEDRPEQSDAGKKTGWRKRMRDLGTR